MSGGYKVVVTEGVTLREGYRAAPRYVVRQSATALKKGRRGRKALAKIARLSRKYGTKV